MDQYNLVGKVYIFPDGVKLSVLQIKMREDELGQTVPVITFTTQQGKSLPKKQLMKQTEFVTSFGHLFGLKEPPIKPLR